MKCGASQQRHESTSKTDVPDASYTVKPLHEGQTKSCEPLFRVSCENLGRPGMGHVSLPSIHCSSCNF